MQRKAVNGSPNEIAVVGLATLPKDKSGPVFEEPWQAQAFALVLQLNEMGLFSSGEWSAALAAELHDAARRGEADDGTRYYDHWVAALEKLVVAKGLTNAAALSCRKGEWLHAYRVTPHGQPVNLRA
jgi:nitrile hydratase accessory protein